MFLKSKKKLLLKQDEVRRLQEQFRQEIEFKIQTKQKEPADKGDS